MPRPALLVLSKSENALVVVDPATGKEVSRVPTGEGPHEVLVVLDAATRKVTKRLAVGSTPVGVLVTPDGKRAFVATTAANRVVEVDLETMVVKGRIAAGGQPDGMAWVGG